MKDVLWIALGAVVGANLRFAVSRWSARHIPASLPYGTFSITSYDVTPDGQYFILIKESEKESAATQLNVVLNWFEELRRRLPAASQKAESSRQ